MQRAGPDHVRFGSEADIEVRRPDVRLTPESGHCLARSGCLLGPLSEVSHRQMSPGDEINFDYVSGSIRILNLPLFAVFVAAARFPAAQG
jgi:hypothetical protein